MIRVFLFILLFPTLVFADARVTQLQALVPGMIEFIQEHTDHVYGGWDYPDIIINEQKEICAGVYLDTRPQCDIAGYYNDDTNTVYIRSTPTQHMVEDRFFEVVLVHELVHFLQYHDGTYLEVTCRRQLEKDAFMIQEKFVKLENIDPQQAPDPLFAMLVSNCPHDTHLFQGGG